MRGVAVALVLVFLGGGVSRKPFEPTSVAFWDARDGLVAGYELRSNGEYGFAAVRRTDDGGRTWRLVRRQPGPLEVTATRGGRLAWLATPAGLLRSSDQGRTWNPVSRLRVVHPSFATAHAGWGVVSSRLLATADGGRTWHE
jgi:photosystem II stability/assembly factor-like uncharacterized protein